VVDGVLAFPPFRLDSSNEQLWCGSKEIRLRCKTFAVLRYLVERPGQLVSKAALLDAVWPDVSVSDSMPAISVHELRKVLGDDAKTPHFIETVQRRGYRFIATVETEADGARPRNSEAPLASQVSAPTNRFVGRERERAELRAALGEARCGRGRLVLIAGEPGIGKSRLCEELSAEAEQKGVAVLVGHCSEMEAVAYLPFVEILESCINRAEAAKKLLRTLGDEGPELGRLLPRLRRRVPELPPPPELSSEEARRSLFDSVCNFLTRQSLERTLLLILEDLHWADDSTLALLSHLSRRIAEIPLMVIGTYRANKSDVGPALMKTLEDLVRGRLATQRELVGLAVTEVALMLQGFGNKVPPMTVAREFFAETDGNPFFVEELFQYLAEEKRLYDSTGRYLSELKIRELDVPRSVQLVVGRRLARLGEATGKLLATAAVIGRSFSFELLERSRGVDAEFALDCLDESEKVGLIRSCATDTEARFEFCHELVRQAVLNQLSAARRQRLHRQVAQAIERIHPEAIEDHYEELAHHYSHTDNIWKAAEYLLLSGEQAVRRSAYGSAEIHLNSGLRLLSKLPESAERDAMEVKLQLTLGNLQLPSKGYGAEEPETALLRVEELCERLGDRAALFDAEKGLITIHNIRGEIRGTLKRAERLFDLAAGESEKVVDAHFLYWQGSVLDWGTDIQPRAHGNRNFSLRCISESRQRKRSIVRPRIIIDSMLDLFCLDPVVFRVP
jgi:DNA-binding winged helix-turn-helix (wHTH) protein